MQIDFTPQDVQKIAQHWTTTQSEQWLKDNRRHLEDEIKDFAFAALEKFVNETVEDEENEEENDDYYDDDYDDDDEEEEDDEFEDEPEEGKVVDTGITLEDMAAEDEEE